jgi:hypothetical protein
VAGLEDEDKEAEVLSAGSLEERVRNVLGAAEELSAEEVSIGATLDSEMVGTFVSELDERDIGELTMGFSVTKLAELSSRLLEGVSEAGVESVMISDDDIVAGGIDELLESISLMLSDGVSEAVSDGIDKLLDLVSVVGGVDSVSSDDRVVSDGTGALLEGVSLSVEETESVISGVDSVGLLLKVKGGVSEEPESLELRDKTSLKEDDSTGGGVLIGGNSLEAVRVIAVDGVTVSTLEEDSSELDTMEGK